MGWKQGIFVGRLVSSISLMLGCNFATKLCCENGFINSKFVLFPLSNYLHFWQTECCDFAKPF